MNRERRNSPVLGKECSPSMSTRCSLFVLMWASCSLPGSAAAQCQREWIDGGSASALDAEVRALTVFDDGAGPALYAGGYFNAAGGVSAKRIAKWEGSSWSPVGGGISSGGWVESLTVFNGALYAGGFIIAAGGVSANNIAKWDGSSWSPLGSGMNDSVNALTVFDDGGGPALYAGGWFDNAGNMSANRIAKWNGLNWSPLGSGVRRTSTAESVVFALTVFDDGTGAALYAGGWFNDAGGVSANNIAKWDGSSWSALGSGITVNDVPESGTVLDVTVFDDGGGPALYACGVFNTAGGVSANHIAKWDGSTWSAVGSGLDGSVSAMAVLDDALYAGGSFTTAGGG